MSTSYKFLIDTNRYAGNFAEELTAYITGWVGEYGGGEQGAQRFLAEVDAQAAESLRRLVVDVSDEHNARRTCAIALRPGWFNHGMGGEFPDGSEVEALAHYKAAVAAYYGDAIKRAQQSNWAPADIERQVGIYERQIAEAQATTTVSKHPAYLSVAIRLRRRPTDEQLALLCNRARAYATAHGLTIAQFRLVTRKLGEPHAELITA